MVSCGNETRSTASTRRPCRASSIAVVAPATRAPTTMTSYRPAPITASLPSFLPRYPYASVWIAPYGTVPFAHRPYASVWTGRTVPYSDGGTASEQRAKAHPRRVGHRRVGRHRGGRPGGCRCRTARRTPWRNKGQLLLALHKPRRFAPGRDRTLGEGDDDRRHRRDHRRPGRPRRPVPAPCGP